MKQLNRRYRNYCIGVAIYFAFSLSLYLIFVGFKFGKVEIFQLSDTIFLPGCVVLANYLFDRRRISTNSSITNGRFRVLIKVILSIGVITLATLLSNEIGSRVGYVDGDTIALGNFGEINGYWTNVVTNIVVVLILGIPTFIRENVIDNKAKEVSGLNTELNLLKLELYSSNVRPHFVFNTLNGIVALIHEEPDKAEEMVLHLSDFLRSSLFSEDANSHCVKDEFSALKDYLHIEQIRFNDNFTFDIRLDESLKDFKVPKFFLLPIVENAIKYNRDEKNIKIVLSAQRQDHKMIFEVTDSGQPFPENLKYNAGINGTLAMLKAMYKENFELIIENKPNKVLRIEVQDV